MPPYIDPELWRDFLEGRQEMQKKNRIPFTAVAQKRILSKLERMHAEGHDVNEALEDAICNSWRSVFPPKPKPGTVASRPAQRSFAEQDRDAAMERWENMTGERHPSRSGPVLDLFANQVRIGDESFGQRH